MNSRGERKAPNILYNDEAPRFLFVDNLKPTEIIVSFTSCSNWLDQCSQSPGGSLSNSSHTAVNKPKDSAKTPERTPTAIDTAPGTANTNMEQTPIAPASVSAAVECMSAFISIILVINAVWMIFP